MRMFFQTYFWIGVQKFFYHAEFFAFFPFTSSVVCVCTFYSEKEKKILKFAYNYHCLNVFMNYIFQRVWSGLVIQILSLHGFAQINCCLVAVKGYFFWKSKIQNNDCVPFWISLTDGLTNYFFFLYFFSPSIFSWICSVVCFLCVRMYWKVAWRQINGWGGRRSWMQFAFSICFLVEVLS